VVSRRLAVHAADLQLLTNYTHLLQVAEDISRHAFRQIDERVVAADVDVADVAALEPGLVGDGAYDVAWLNAVDVTYFQAEGFEGDVVVATAGAAPARPVVVTTSLAVIVNARLVVAAIMRATWHLFVAVACTVIIPAA